MCLLTHRVLKKPQDMQKKKVFVSITVFENQKKVSFNIASEASYVYILS